MLVASPTQPTRWWRLGAVGTRLRLQMERAVTRRYRDPLDEIWLAAARTLGLRVVRSDEVYAAYDGQGTLSIARSEHFTGVGVHQQPRLSR